ncbi:MAG: cytochrome c [Chloroflexi bacterium]|nr:cytochrome c [Chloroflexota bacterium]
MKSSMTRLVGTLLAGVAMLVVLAACGGPTGGTTPAPATPQPTATSRPTPTSLPTPTATPVPTPTPTQSAVLPPTPTASAGGNDLLALGKEVFEKKAGNVGCKACHGISGKGDVGIGPDIRGKTADDIRRALKESDSPEEPGLMAQVVTNLNDQDIEAVAAYLAYLAEQP